MKLIIRRKISILLAAFLIFNYTAEPAAAAEYQTISMPIM